MKRAGLYVRVSTVEQRERGMSVDAQISALIAFCEANGYTPYKIYNDAGISARKSYKKRPALLEMIRDCSEKKLDIVLFTRLDRFFRSVPDYYACINQMAGVPWRAISEDYETTTPDGVFKVNIMLSVAQSEADKTSARLKDAFAYKRARGDYLGKPPTGYIRKNGQLVKDPETSKAVSVMFDTYLHTFSPMAAMNAAADHGLRLERAHFIKMITSKAYCGEAAGGHPCEPYITPEQWEKAQEVKRSRRTTLKYGKRVYLFSGIAVCGYCGRRMVAKSQVSHHIDGTTVIHKRYVCDSYLGKSRTCPHLMITERKLEDYLLTHVDKLLQDIRVNDHFSVAGYKSRVNNKNRLKAKLERLKEVYIDGDMDREEYRTKKREIESELDAIVIPSDRPPQLPDGWKEVYDQLTAENKQAFWKSAIKSIIVTNETKDHPEVIFAHGIL